MKYRRLGLLLPFVALLVSPAAAKEAETLEGRVETLVRPYLEAKALLGGVVGAVKDGERRVIAVGRLAKDAVETPDEDTVYEIGSITKVFTGILLADLVVRGKVQLDQPVEELLPDGTKVPSLGERKITLKDLATHTSGLPRMPSNFRPADVTNPYVDYDAAKLYAYLKDAKLETEPGTMYAYSNLGAGLLGHALARAAGMPYEALLRARIFEPLGMKSSTIALTDELKARLAPGTNADLVPVPNWDLDVFAGAGAIRSTVSDMLRFVQANLAADGPLREALDLAWTIQFTPEGRGSKMGLGWHVSKDDDRGRWHNGQTGGYHAFCGIRRDKQVGVVVLTNTASMEVDALGRAIEKVLLGERPVAPELRVAVEIDPKVLADYVGRYRLGEEMVLEVTRKGDALFLSATGKPALALLPSAPDTFFARAVNADFRFERSDEGRVVRMIARQGAETARFVREP